MISSRPFGLVVLPLSALLIAALVWNREQREPVSTQAEMKLRGPAPLFELTNQAGAAVRLKSYSGRTRIVLVFYDAERGVDGDPLIRILAENYPSLKRAGIEVFGISLATPYANSKAQQRMGVKIPFDLLTDIDLRNPAPAPAHRAWGRFDSARNLPMPGLFFIDRSGNVSIGENGFPQPVSQPEASLERLIDGEWPAE